MEKTTITRVEELLTTEVGRDKLKSMINRARPQINEVSRLLLGIDLTDNLPKVTPQVAIPIIVAGINQYVDNSLEAIKRCPKPYADD